jgi:hypothetical protein
MHCTDALAGAGALGPGNDMCRCNMKACIALTPSPAPEGHSSRHSARHSTRAPEVLPPGMERASAARLASGTELIGAGAHRHPRQNLMHVIYQQLPQDVSG